MTVTLKEGQVLLHSLLEAGAGLAHECDGKLACATCCVVVKEGGASLSPPSEEELDMLDSTGMLEEGARLSCQVAGAGDVVVRILRAEPPAHQIAQPVVISEEAARFLAAQLGKHPGAVGMRLAVAPAGCSGLRYRVDPIEALGPQDALFECAGVRVAVDPASLPFVQGTTVRPAREGLARRLRFHNPNARQSAGCGESFST